MKHLFAMLFFNIVIGSTVMFKKEKAEMEADFKNKTFWQNKEKHIQNQLKVVDIYSTLFWPKKHLFRPSGLFQIGVTLQNKYGTIEHVGVKAVKPIMVVSYS
jgi:hypothetical protein